MKLTAFAITIILFLALSTSVQARNYSRINNRINASSNGNNSSIKVNIENNVNTNSNNSTKKESSTNVRLHQTGEGTSQVTINGENYELEGPGELNINDTEISTTIPSPTSIPTATPTPTPTSTPTETPSLTESPSPTNVPPNNLPDSSLIMNGIFVKQFDVILNIFTKLFSNLN